jgi:hypothetical protein
MCSTSFATGSVARSFAIPVVANIVQCITHQLGDSTSSWLKTRTLYFTPRFHAFASSFFIPVSFYPASLPNVLPIALAPYNNSRSNNKPTILSTLKSLGLAKLPIMTDRRVRWADYRRSDRITGENLAQVPDAHFN